MNRNSHRGVRYLGHSASPSKARTRARQLADEKGVALTEFALVLPLLMLLLLGMIDFGKAFNYWLDESDLAHQGARFAAVNRNPATGGGLGTGSGACTSANATPTFQCYLRLKADTEELSNGSGVSTTGPLLVCVYFPEGTQVGKPVEVMAKTTYHFLPFISKEIFGVNLFQSTLKASATMRLEQTPSPLPANDPAC